MKKITMVRLLMVLAALYDGVLGLAFLLAGQRVYDHFNVLPPNHWGYVQFPALLLIVFALMFAAVAISPHKHRGLILCGIGLKLSYCGVVFWHMAHDGLPSMWAPFAWIDAVWVLAFAWAYHVARSHRAASD